MGKGLKFTAMAIIIRDNSLMACHKDMGHTLGRMEVNLKVILSKVLLMAMDYGKLAKMGFNRIKGTT
jgi:ACR3 family arsenite efflux pump ArsB